MSRTAIASLLCLSCVSLIGATDDQAQNPQLDLANLKVGDIGVLPPTLDPGRIRPCCESRISWKVADDYLVLEVQCYDVVQSVGENGLPGPPSLRKASTYDVVVKGVNFADRNEGERIQITASLRVTGIAKVKSAKQPTVHALELAPPPSPKKP